jgi:hypothetical protein
MRDGRNEVCMKPSPEPLPSRDTSPSQSASPAANLCLLDMLIVIPVLEQECMIYLLDMEGGETSRPQVGDDQERDRTLSVISPISHKVSSRHTIPSQVQSHENGALGYREWTRFNHEAHFFQQS